MGGQLLENYIEFKDIGKSFPGVRALDGVGFRVSGGRVLALLGENGAGKSTLLKILSGDIQPDQGTITINGQEARFTDPLQALKANISVIYQERQLMESMTVMENVFMEDVHSKYGLVNFRKLRRATQEILDKFGLPISPDEIVGKLSVAYQQMVEIMKAYRRDSSIIAFDEPTAPLTDKEIEILFRIIRQLREEGKCILYVSHRLAEIFMITDEIVVLKDGKMVKTLITSETNERELITAMVGRDIGDTYASLKRNADIGEVILEVNNLMTDDVYDVSFKLRKGEIVGFAGLVGAGRTEVVRAIFGADKVISGEIIFEGNPVRFKSPKEAIDAGIALCPEDRKEQGLVLGLSIGKNISIPVLEKMKTGLFLDKAKEKALANSSIDKYSIKTPTVDKLVVELSGGNQQKVILGRWTSDEMVTKVLILDEPTKGIDVGTKAEVYQMMCDFAKEGIGVIFISSELTEVINVADTIIVMHNGHITGTIPREEATEERVLSYAMLA